MIYKDDLQRVYALIERPEAWTQEVSARDANGAEIEVDSDAACSFCIDGAFIKCGLDNFASEAALGLPQHHTPEFNDSHTHSEVLALLRAAIDRAPVRETREVAP